MGSCTTVVQKLACNRHLSVTGRRRGGITFRVSASHRHVRRPRKEKSLQTITHTHSHIHKVAIIQAPIRHQWIVKMQWKCIFPLHEAQGPRKWQTATANHNFLTGVPLPGGDDSEPIPTLSPSTPVAYTPSWNHGPASSERRIAHPRPPKP